MKKILFLLPLSLVMLAGCGGGGSDTKNINTTTTMGQELQDLKAAKDQGLLSDSEYDSARDDVLEKYDH
ncbi:SHOCT domain-containing protein [Micavibrio aeruginosavorus]|uniref:SHOCT domain-containing protein n=1 Tax=Micavibrio aeruginosavorus TaxID=349221 RepID=UPI003F4ACE84